MGFHAHFLESCWRTFIVLSLFALFGEPRSFSLQMEPPRFGRPLRQLSFRVLGLGHCEQPEESISYDGKRNATRKRAFSEAAMVRNRRPQEDRNRDRRFDTHGRLVYVTLVFPLHTLTDYCKTAMPGSCTTHATCISPYHGALLQASRAPFLGSTLFSLHV